jgi:chromosome segregation ATPase
MTDRATASAALKQLQTQLRLAEEELQQAKSEQRNATIHVQAVQARITDIRSRIEAAKADARGVIVTEHALLRYIERVMGVDLEEIRQKVVTAAVEAQVRLCGNGKYPVGDTHTVRVKDNTVITVLVGDDRE